MMAFFSSRWMVTGMSLCALLLNGCASIYSTPPSSVHQPMTARPHLQAQASQTKNGAIYQVRNGGQASLFGDRRARHIGDTITINLVERNTAQKGSNAKASRSSTLAGEITQLGRVPLGSLNGLAIAGTNSSDFSGSGAAAANNVFNGTITVTVIEVLPNRNLLVSGEKQMAINQGSEYIRFSGVVNPDNVTAANTVESTQVADARIEYRGSGYIDEAQRMGWLQRFFNVILPL